MKEQGVKLAFHHHVGTIFETRRDFEMFIKYTGPSVGLTLTLLTLPMVAATRRNHQAGGRAYCSLPHQRCTSGCNEESSRAGPAIPESSIERRITVPGDGDLNWDEIFAALKEFDYEGWLVVEAEQDPAVAEPQTYANMAHKNLTAYVEKAGL